MHNHSPNQEMLDSIRHCEVVAYSGEKYSIQPRDPVAIEEPLEIRDATFCASDEWIVGNS